MKRILVLGGGASGIVAAISAAEHAAADTEVILLEQNAKLGKKLLATGNGRCNLDNLHCSIDHYFTSSRETAAEMLEYIAQINLPQWFAAHGLLCREADEGRLYPYSNQAADVVNLLTYRLKQTGVQIYTDCRVTNINRNHSVYIINTADGAEFYGDAVICAMGGNAGPQFGSEG
ncbi:MAG: NAD(P)/FAD-dependent oxidoreductase, partial [Peptococcaceae bacterium]|nr:NAD(P)/FAD-dependent oxidoreductase [Peptococcaceae bacterium]